MNDEEHSDHQAAKRKPTEQATEETLPPIRLFKPIDDTTVLKTFDGRYETLTSEGLKVLWKCFGVGCTLADLQAWFAKRGGRVEGLGWSAVLPLTCASKGLPKSFPVSCELLVRRRHQRETGGPCDTTVWDNLPEAWKERWESRPPRCNEYGLQLAYLRHKFEETRTDLAEASALIAKEAAHRRPSADGKLDSVIRELQEAILTIKAPDGKAAKSDAVPSQPEPDPRKQRKTRFQKIALIAKYYETHAGGTSKAISEATGIDASDVRRLGKEVKRAMHDPKRPRRSGWKGGGKTDAVDDSTHCSICNGPLAASFECTVCGENVRGECQTCHYTNTHPEQAVP